jgi:hypothetical protein
MCNMDTQNAEALWTSRLHEVDSKSDNMSLQTRVKHLETGKVDQDTKITTLEGKITSLERDNQILKDRLLVRQVATSLEKRIAYQAFSKTTRPGRYCKLANQTLKELVELYRDGLDSLNSGIAEGTLEFEGLTALERTNLDRVILLSFHVNSATDCDDIIKAIARLKRSGNEESHPQQGNIDDIVLLRKVQELHEQVLEEEKKADTSLTAADIATKTDAYSKVESAINVLANDLKLNLTENPPEVKRSKV